MAANGGGLANRIAAVLNQRDRNSFAPYVEFRDRPVTC